MLKTDYAKVSKVYDKNKGRVDFPKDEEIGKLLETKESITVLDLAWVYKYCPETFFEDKFRFWQKDLMIYELKKNHFANISAKLEYYEKYKPINELVENYKRRDSSQLAMIGDEFYNKGLQRVMQEVSQGETEYKDIVALLEIRCEKN